MRHERYGLRPSIFSEWLRGLGDPVRVIDADWIFYCRFCNKPIFLAEEALDVGQSFKTSTVTAHLGRDLSVPAYVILSQTDSSNHLCGGRVQRISPTRYPPDGSFLEATEQDLRALIHGQYAGGCAGCGG